MKRHPLDALTLVALTFVLVAGVLWGMWYAGWEPVSLAIAAPSCSCSWAPSDSSRR